MASILGDSSLCSQVQPSFWATIRDRRTSPLGSARSVWSSLGRAIPKCGRPGKRKTASWRIRFHASNVRAESANRSALRSAFLRLASRKCAKPARPCCRKAQNPDCDRPGRINKKNEVLAVLGISLRLVLTHQRGIELGGDGGENYKNQTYDGEIGEHAVGALAGAD